MKYDEVIIRCFRIGHPDILQVPGMSITSCTKCQSDVWIAPSSVKILKKVKAVVVCNICEDLKPKEDGAKIDILPLSNEQISEIKDGLWNRKNRN